METSRFFVSNLLPNTTERDLSTLFQDYGEVTRVEVKTKKNLVDEEDVQVLAFVTVKISADDAQYCLDELNWQKLNGAKIRVSLAKESFLERLKREREEAEAAAAGVPSYDPDADNENASALLKGNAENKRRVFGEDEELDDDDIAPELLITKKRAASSMHNGRIVIQNYDAAPLHVIETKKTAKHLEGKSLSADQKRKESLNKMKHQYQQQKSAIQQALAGTDTTSKKIKFSDAEEDEETGAPAANAKSKTNIFESGDEEEDEQHNGFKPELLGKQSERLAQMQSKQSLDPRFRIDAKFVEVDEAEQEAEVDNTENERDWQMGILEQVVGTKVDTGSFAQKAAKNKKMLRFDPSNEEHQKYLRSNNQVEPLEDVQNQKQKKSKQQQWQDEENKRSATNNGPEVSKEVFYTVSDTLTQSLKTRGDGFSLLNMFGQNTQLDEREQQLQKVSNEKILVNKLDKNALNPFSYDSSSDSDNEAHDNAATQATDARKGKTGKQKSKVPVVVESFFIPKNDARLKEGAKFFKYTKEQDPEQNYEEVRNRLKLLIKTKITKSKKNFAAAGGKMARNKRR